MRMGTETHAGLDHIVVDDQQIGEPLLLRVAVMTEGKLCQVSSQPKLK